MIFADKLIQLRKKNGWSQEELANLMNVSRQSISKWEGAQSIPDLDKMVKLSELFGVSTDFLLKDEIEECEVKQIRGVSDEASPVRRVSMEEASGFLKVKEATSKNIACATFLCILSPICLILLAAASEVPSYGISENLAAGAGLIILLLLVTVAVVVFIACGNKTSAYEYLEKEVFETEYGVSGMVKEKRENYRGTYNMSCIVGTCLCILSSIPLFTAMMIDSENDLFSVAMLSVMLLIAGVGAMFFIRSGIVWESYNKLLQEGDYTKAKKQKKSIKSVVAVTYWMTATAVFLAYSFITDQWKDSWIIWAVAGVLYPAVAVIVGAIEKRND